LFQWLLEHLRRFTGSLRFKLSFYTGLVAFVTIVVFAVHSIASQERTLIESRIQAALKDSEVIKAAIWNGMMTKDREVIQQIVKAIGVQENFEEINIYDTKGKVHYTSSDDAASLIGRPVEGGEAGFLFKDLEKDSAMRYTLKKGTNVVTVVNPIMNDKSCSTVGCHADEKDQRVLGILEVKLKLKGLRAAVRAAARDITIFAFLLFLLISTIIGLAVVILVSNPVNRLRNKAERISRGDYPDPEETATGVDSISVLSRSLDEMCRQISERENLLDESRRMYKELFEKVPCYLILVSRDYRIVRANQAFISDFGDPVGRHCFALFKGGESKCPMCLVEQTFEDGLSHRTYEVWNLAGDEGRKAHVIVTTAPIMGEDGTITEVLEMAVDITRMVQLQQEVKQKEEQFGNLFNNVPCYLTVVDASFRIAFYNNMFAEDFGRWWGENCYRAYKGRSEKCENCPVEKTFSDGQSHYSEEIWHRDGKDQHIVVRTSPIRDEKGNITAVMEMCTNVTELKMLENKLAMLGDTIAGTSHAVKNILSGLEGGVYVVDSGLRAGNRDRIFTGWAMVKKNVERVSELVKDILYASRDRVPEYQESDPGQILTDICELYEAKARAQGIDLIRNFSSTLGRGMLDPNGIHNVLSNLISNSVAACQEAAKADALKITVSGKLEDGWLIIEVADNGAGMSDEVKQNLFKKFYSTKGSKGTGLGMLVTRKIVEENHGTIFCDSTLGEGTRFVVRLPFEQIMPQADTPDQSQRNAKLR
jgi:histidine kinase